FYIAELVLALEHLHKYNIVYRDLKPENILLDATGHVALCDFGLSKPDLAADQLTNTFCGTTEYLAPEVLLDDSGYSKLVDFWSLGVLLFEMCCGWSPFYAEDTQTMYRNICFGKIRFPRGVIGEDGKQFVKGLLNRNPRHRLGAQNDAAELKEHPFFKSIDWHALALKQVTPPFKPNVDSDESTANFDPEFTEADLKEQGIDFDGDETEDENVEEAFAGLTMSNTAKNGGAPGLVGSQASTATTMSAATPADVTGVQIQGKGQQVGKGRGKKGATASSPITNSVQENFRGFTYMGESMIGHAAGLLGQDRDKDKDWRDDEFEDEVVRPVNSDDEWEDEDDVAPEMKGRKGRQGSELQMD
ncbi:Serine/threonine-protein kinase sck1, partial [Tulasnella sp. 427]